MEQLKSIKEAIIAQVQGQIGNLQSVDTKELGEAVDMIKDLSEAAYYCSIVKAMEEKDKEEKNTQYKYNTYYYTDPWHWKEHDKEYMYDDMMPQYDRERDMDKWRGRMYYTSNGGNMNGGNTNGGSSNSSGNGGTSSSNGGNSYYTERDIPLNFRDEREGRSPIRRKMYMETKEMHQGKEKQMKELEKYLQELSADITEMIEDASPEEKQLLQKKIAVLATKVNV